VLSTGSGAVRTGRRSFDFIPIAIVLFGLAMLVFGVALFYGAAHWPMVLAMDAAASAKIYALAMIVIAVSIVAASLRPALRSLRPHGRGVEAAGAGSLLFGRASFGSRDHDIPFPAADLVALKLSEPESCPGSEMTLSEAVRRAYQQSETTAAACFANTFASGPDDIVKMYATFIAEHVPVYGCKRPSSAVERVSLSAPLKEFQIEGGSLILKERAGAATYTDLRIKTADYSVVLERLATAS
jgi:hypothetical protein